MKNILITYATMAGSTADVARVVGDELTGDDLQVEVLPLAEVKSLDLYDGVVIGAPMIMGWHRDAMKFLKEHRHDFQRIPLALFVMAMSLTRSQETSLDDVPVFVDEKLPKLPRDEGKLSFRERYAMLPNYIQPILKTIHPIKPVSIGVFGGRLEYGRLKWWAVLFAMLIIQAPAGDLRNWSAIRTWTQNLKPLLR